MNNKGVPLVRVTKHILRELSGLGYLDKDIAKAFGVGLTTVWARRKKWGIPSGRQKAQDQQP